MMKISLIPTSSALALLIVISAALLVMGCSDSAPETPSIPENPPKADSPPSVVSPSTASGSDTPVPPHKAASPRVTPGGEPAPGEQDVMKTNYKHVMETRIPKAIEELETQRVETIRKMETALEKARRRLADWEAKGHEAVPADPVESQNLRFQIQQESQEEFFELDPNDMVLRDWKLTIERLKGEIESEVEMVKRNQEGRAKGYLGMKVKDYDLRFVDAAPAMLAEVEEMGQKLIAVREGETWKKGVAELKQIHERIDNIVSGRSMREAEEAKKELAEEEAKAFPWKTPAEAAAYAFVGNELWNLDTLVKERSPIHTHRGVPHLIQNHSALLAWLPAPDDRSSGGSCPDLTDAGSEKPEKEAYYAIRDTPGLPAMDQFQLSTGDWRRFIFMAEGDLWRGTIDWRTLQATGVTRVTHTSQLGNARILHWHGRTVWIWTNLSSEKPVARIDLITGEIAETPSLEVFSDREGETFISPSGTLLVRATRDHSFIRVFDLERNRPRAIENRFESHFDIKTKSYREVRAQILQLGSVDGKPGWMADERLLVEVHAPMTNRLFTLDLRTGSVAPVPSPPGEDTGDYVVERQLLGKSQFVARRIWRDESQDEHQSRFVLDGTSGKRLPFPAGVTYLQPVNERLVLFHNKDGGLSGSGTWIWDIVSGESSRLTPLYVSNSHDHIAYLPERGRLLAHASGAEGAQGLRKLLVFDFKSGAPPEVRELPVDFSSQSIADGRLAGISTKEVDLGFSPQSPDPWTATAALPVVRDPSINP